MNNGVFYKALCDIELYLLLYVGNNEQQYLERAFDIIDKNKKRIIKKQQRKDKPIR